MKSLFDKDIYLNDEAFNEAATQLETLAEKMSSLRSDIESLLSELKTGWESPAGEKFFLACGNTLIQPLIDQVNVINHVSSNLKTAKNSYETVFNDYRQLNEAIKNAKQ